MNKNYLNCNSIETQTHIFENCQPILSKLKTPNPIKLSKIFGTIEDQCEVIDTIMNIEAIRKYIKENSYLVGQMPGPVLLQPHL